MPMPDAGCRAGMGDHCVTCDFVSPPDVGRQCACCICLKAQYCRSRDTGEFPTKTRGRRTRKHTCAAQRQNAQSCLAHLPAASFGSRELGILSQLICRQSDTTRAVQLELSHHDSSLNSYEAQASPRFSACRILCCAGHRFLIVRAAVFPSDSHARPARTHHHL
jgi:hypothetical protein